MTMKNSGRYQYLASISANLLIIVYGIGCGWPSVSFSILQSEDESPLDHGPMTTSELSWVVSLFSVSGFLGTVIFGLMSDLVGRKTYLCLLAIPQIISSILIYYGTNIWYLYISRLLTGLSGGGAYIFVPLFVAEISEDRVRGRLGTLITVSANLGILLSFIMGDFLSYSNFSLSISILPLVFLGIFISFPDSPIYLMKKNRVAKAEQALRVYRNVGDKQSSIEFQNEILKLKNSISDQEKENNNSKITLSDFYTKTALKAFQMSFMLFMMNECSGGFVLISYTAALFAESGSNIPANYSAMIVAFIQLMGTYVSTILIDRLGRRPLLIFSSFGSGVSLVGLGSYLYLNSLGINLEVVNWIPVLTFSSLVFIASCGVIPVSYVMVTEIMPPKIRGPGTSISLAFSWLVTFILLKFLPIVSEVAGLHFVVAFFAIISFSGTVFVLFVLPETKGKSFEEIQQKLNS